MSDKTRSYCFTLNNYSHEEIAQLQECDAKYIVWGKEVGESGTPHLQGFVSFVNPRTITGIKRMKGAWYRMNLRPSEKPLSAIDYCKKGEQTHKEWTELGVRGPNYGKNADVWEKGKFEQGARHDLDRAYQAIRDGTSVDEIAWKEPALYQAANRAMERMEDIRLRGLKRTEMTEGIWVFGKTGVGKSVWALEQGGDNFYAYPYDNDWWDNYRGEDTVIIDEFRGQIPYNVILRMVDRNPFFNVRRRCRAPMPFISKKVIITSSLPPWKVFKNLDKEDSLDQLYRRFKIYEKFEDKTVEINPKEYIEELD